MCYLQCMNVNNTWRQKHLPRKWRIGYINPSFICLVDWQMTPGGRRNEREGRSGGTCSGIWSTSAIDPLAHSCVSCCRMAVMQAHAHPESHGSHQVKFKIWIYNFSLTPRHFLSYIATSTTSPALQLLPWEWPKCSFNFTSCKLNGCQNISGTIESVERRKNTCVCCHPNHVQWVRDVLSAGLS